MSSTPVSAKMRRKAYITGKCEAPQVFKYSHMHDQRVLKCRRKFPLLLGKIFRTAQYINGVYFSVYSSAFLGPTPNDILHLCSWNLFELVQADCSRRKHVNICMYKIVFPLFCTVPSGLSMFIRNTTKIYFHRRCFSWDLRCLFSHDLMCFYWFA